MRTKNVAIAAILTLVMAGIASIAYAHPNAANTVQNHPNNGRHFAANVNPANSGHHPQKLNLKVGDTIALSNMHGRYRDASNSTVKGNASGSFTFTVTGVFKSGYTLSITSGTITIGSATYTVNGGSAQIGLRGIQLVGQGTAGSGVAFLIHAGIRQQQNTTRGMVMLDLQNGSTEYLVLLRSTSS